MVVTDTGGSAAINNITINPHGAETINGGASYVINLNRASVWLQSDGTNWFVTAVYNGTAV